VVILRPLLKPAGTSDRVSIDEKKIAGEGWIARNDIMPAGPGLPERKEPDD